MDDETGRQAITETFGYIEPERLDAAAQDWAAYQRYAYTRLRLQPGQRVIDVGCGPATDTIALARIVGPTGRVTGVDHDPAMIAIATLRARAAGVESWTNHAVADATHLPFADGEFDAAHADRVFMHLRHPEQALGEMVRVTRPGGRIVVFEPDWATISIAIDDADLERRLVRFAVDSLANGYIGRRLKGLFVRQGLRDIAVEPFPTQTMELQQLHSIVSLSQIEAMALERGVLTHEEVERWHHELERADAEGRFLMSTIDLLVSGTKAEQES
jgi:SAM-dependent methyltransferase